MGKLQAVRGMNDYFANTLALWRYVEKELRGLVNSYGYSEIVTPIVERAELFERGVGADTDLVAKEMYKFQDRSGDWLVLRPEGTAGCVRAGLESGKFYHQHQKWFYFGPMFRHERPQKGRYRQFYQFGVEAYGWSEVALDAEILQLTSQIWSTLKLKQWPVLHLSSLGNAMSRARYRQALVEYFERYRAWLSAEDQQRLAHNPLRMLDSKDPTLQPLVAEAPSLFDYLDPLSQKRLEQLCQLLEKLGVKYQLDPRLVRGLDYYNETVFEWMIAMPVSPANASSETSGSDSGREGDQTGDDRSSLITVCAGGRYDSLVGDLARGGGSSARSLQVPAMGFALGFERLLAVVAEHAELASIASFSGALGFYLIALEEQFMGQLMQLATKLRRGARFRVEVDYQGGSLKNQLKRADGSGANWAIIVGEQEAQQQQYLLKPLRAEDSYFTQQQLVTEAQLLTWVERVSKEV